ncbi:uncharacterized protein LOC141906267 [Tubulanus polymorphus]|uniref:uncharacterized protein LOC141906267 n=1 Tax=Tubulanus polymorphus TaxID=672921 RepID=UPI003DA1E9BE
MQRVRCKKYPKDPATHDELFITDTWSLTREDGEEFLMYDNASTTSRIMIFATDICLKKLCEADTAMRRDYFSRRKTVVIDFELAVLNATKSVFGDIEIRGCFYHLSQCIYR